MARCPPGFRLPLQGSSSPRREPCVRLSSHGLTALVSSPPGGEVAMRRALRSLTGRGA
jgi:hypothetical protein